MRHLNVPQLIYEFEYWYNGGECAINTNEEILNYAIQNGILDISAIQTQIEMNEKKKLLEMHKYKIWQGKNNKFYTYLPDEKKTNNRKLIKRNSLESLENMLIEYYKSTIEEPYFNTVFYEWLNKKIEYKEISMQTYNRYEVDFNTYLKDSSLCSKKLKDIDESFLEDFIKKMIAQREFTAKKWGNLRIIIKGTFKYAKSKGYTKIFISSFLNEIDISPKSFKRSYRNAEELVFNYEEITKIKQYITHSEPSIINYGILLDFLTGLRSGELAALRWENIKNNRIIINSTEVHYKKDGVYVYEVRPFPKTEAGFREVIINSEANQILKQIRLLNPFGEYVFMRNNERVKGKAFTRKLIKLCEYTGVKSKSLNKVRKTYATTLINGNVDESLIISMMGHTDLKTTKGYYYINNATREQEEKQICNALSRSS